MVIDVDKNSDGNMKRKQFHLTVAEEKILYETAKKHNISEAEVVRLAIREYAAKNADHHNSLVEMAELAKLHKKDMLTDLSINHDAYLAGDT